MNTSSLSGEAFSAPSITQLCLLPAFLSAIRQCLAEGKACPDFSSSVKSPALQLQVLNRWVCKNIPAESKDALIQVTCGGGCRQHRLAAESTTRAKGCHNHQAKFNHLVHILLGTLPVFHTPVLKTLCPAHTQQVKSSPHTEGGFKPRGSWSSPRLQCH